MAIYAGTSGLVLPQPSKQFYPPEFQDKSRLQYYGSIFNSIEINSSFYKVPLQSTIKRWTNEVPDGFRFTFKLWREITHNKNLFFRSEDIDRFMQVIDNAGEKKGSLLIQFPASIQSSNFNNLRELLTLIRLNDPANSWKTAIEFRHSSWYQEEVTELLKELNMSAVIHDMPKSRAPLVAVAGDFVYLRFHGPDGGYRGSYTDDFLYEYAQYIKEWQADGMDIYVYFNNTMGDAIQNLLTLKRYSMDEQ